MDGFTHFNNEGRARMVDVSDKKETKRTAVARGALRMRPETLQLINHRKIEKGDVLAVAQIAGIMAAKKTADLIPMCHPISLTGIDISFSDKEEDTIIVEATVNTTNVTGVEMEALTAVSIAMLTIYDMCKALDKEMVIGETYLVTKTGGKSGDFHRIMEV